VQVKRLWFLVRTVLPLLIRTRTRPVLFSRPGALGDIICTFPAALELKKRHPKAIFIYSCHQDFASLPGMGAVTKQVTSAQFTKASRWAFLFSAIYQFEYGDERPDSASVETIIAEFCRRQGVAVDDAHPHLQVASAVLSKVKRLLEADGIQQGPLILIHPGPSWPVREWPRESWISLVEALRSRGFTNIIQLGVGKHVQLGSLPGIAIPNVRSLADQLTVEETVALVSLSQLLVGIDSGLLHIAASLRTPAVGMFGTTSPQFRFSKKSSCSFVVSNVECQGCHHRIPRLHWMTGCPYGIKCMKDIRMDEILSVCLSKLVSAGNADS
jgi:ADP-heptose:LPS heptosyltransferase